MPKIEAKGIKQYEKALAALSDYKTVVKMCKYSLYDASSMMLDELKKATPVGDDPRTSGDLRDSLITTPMKDDNGFVSERITFVGYDRKGTPNMLIARTLESGRSGPRGITGKHPFVRQTVRRCTNLAEFMIDKSINEYLSHFIKKEK